MATEHKTEPISNPLINLFRMDRQSLQGLRNEAVENMIRKYSISRLLIRELNFEGSLEAIGLVILGWCADPEQASKVSECMKTPEERASFLFLLDSFRRGMKNLYSTDKLVANPLVPSVTQTNADTMIATTIPAEMILEIFFMHCCLLGAGPRAL